MSPLQDARALLVRQQAEKLQLENDLKATPQGTKEFGERASRLRDLGSEQQATRARIKTLSQGAQPSLL